MIEFEIRKLQGELNNLIDKGVSLEMLYELSVKLDGLIAEYYIGRENMIKYSI